MMARKSHRLESSFSVMNSRSVSTRFARFLTRWIHEGFLYPHAHRPFVNRWLLLSYRGHDEYLRGLPPSLPFSRTALVFAFELTDPPSLPKNRAACDAFMESL
jgi:hypothetical protein